MVLNGAFISSNHWAKQGFFKISDFGYLKMLNSISCTSLKRTPFKSYCVTFFWQNGPVFDLTFWLLLLLKNIYFSINKNKVLPWVLCRRGGGICKICRWLLLLPKTAKNCMKITGRDIQIFKNLGTRKI